MATAPKVLEAYQVLHQLFTQSSLSAEEKTVVWQTINTEHKCGYCVPAHTAIAHMMKIEPSLIATLKNNQDLENPKLQVLKNTTLSLVRNRGHLTED